MAMNPLGYRCSLLRPRHVLIGIQIFNFIYKVQLSDYRLKISLTAKTCPTSCVQEFARIPNTFLHKHLNLTLTPKRTLHSENGEAASHCKPL